MIHINCDVFTLFHCLHISSQFSNRVYRVCCKFTIINRISSRLRFADILRNDIAIQTGNHCKLVPYLRVFNFIRVRYNIMHLLWPKYLYKAELKEMKIKPIFHDKRFYSTCRIWGFHGSDYEGYRLLGCEAVYSVQMPPTCLLAGSCWKFFLRH
jgi:hypothetical protein